MLTLVTTAVETVTSSQSGRPERKQNHTFLLCFFSILLYNKGEERFLATVTAKYGIKVREIAQERFLLASQTIWLGRVAQTDSVNFSDIMSCFCIYIFTKSSG